MIELRNVDLDIAGRRLLEGIDANVSRGEFVAVLGPNGAGKTTLLRAIAGLHAASSGAILFKGSPVERLPPPERARSIGFVTSDEVLLDALRVRDVVAIGRFPHHRWWQWREAASDETAIARALGAVQIEDFAERLFATLSSGERQRVWIALGLAQETPVLLLDEPTSHLDVRVAHDILALLRQLTQTPSMPKTVICALHDINEAAAYADRIALVGKGRLLAFASPDAVLASDVLEAAYGVAMERVRLADGRLRVFAREDQQANGTAERPSPRPNG
jgi:ABC-type cobalamin/Fe3+-siderophores transport system ATPase subunit